jgi:hypothetical protein
MIRILRLFLLAAATLAALPAWADPPARVGRISVLNGDVTLRNSYSDETELAPLNWPVSSEDVIATGRLARAEVRIGSTAVRLDEATELEFVRLDDEHLHLHLARGTAIVRVRSGERANEFELTTPQGRVVLLQPGNYRFEADLGDTTAITALQGEARFESRSASMDVRTGQRLDVQGNDSQRFQTSEALRDDFDDWSIARDQRSGSAQSLRYVSGEMTGFEDLDDHGDWRDSPEFGAIWYPRAMPMGWAPYRWGRWARVEPWGWTWIDDMPWGFAPFHYGRWALVDGVWAWAPGRAVGRPVYAPALVAWVGQPDWSVALDRESISAVGWFPLAPHEVYYPSYRCSTRYVRNVNSTHVADVSRIRDARDVDLRRLKYAYRSQPQALTVAPSAAVANGRPLRHEVVTLKNYKLLDDLPIANDPPAATRWNGRQRLDPLPRASNPNLPGGGAGTDNARRPGLRRPVPDQAHEPNSPGGASGWTRLRPKDAERGDGTTSAGNGRGGNPGVRTPPDGNAPRVNPPRTEQPQTPPAGTPWRDRIAPRPAQRDVNTPPPNPQPGNVADPASRRGSNGGRLEPPSIRRDDAAGVRSEPGRNLRREAPPADTRRGTAPQPAAAAAVGRSAAQPDAASAPPRSPWDSLQPRKPAEEGGRSGPNAAGR